LRINPGVLKGLFKKIIGKRISVKEAAKMLNISEQDFIKLCKEHSFDPLENTNICRYCKHFSTTFDKCYCKLNNRQVHPLHTCERFERRG